MNLRLLPEKLRVRRTRTVRSEIPPLSFKEIEYRMNTTALSLFEQHRSKLLDNPPLYLVPAGISQSSIGPNGTSGIDYLLKGLILYKMAYIVQYYLNCKCSGEVMSPGKNHLLESMEPMGQA